MQFFFDKPAYRLSFMRGNTVGTVGTVGAVIKYLIMSQLYKGGWEGLGMYYSPLFLSPS
jgi:hypothetical protein